MAKLDASGSTLVFSTFLGGSDNDAVHAIAVDGIGAVYLGGRTASSDFPTTPGAFDTSFNGSTDVFVAKLDASGSTLVFSTFLGGSDYEEPQAIVVDAGTPLVLGSTISSDFPTTPGGHRTFNGTVDGFLTKLDASGGALVYSMLFGGSDNELAYGLARDGAGAAYVTGWTDSSDFPTTPGAFDTSFNSREAFVTKFNSCPVTSASNYGTGWPGTLGVPTITSSPPVLCMQTTVSIGNSLGTTTPAVLVVGSTALRSPRGLVGRSSCFPASSCRSFCRGRAPACLMSSAVMNSAA